MVSGVNAWSPPVDFTPIPGERRLEIGIIGAGIAGLGAAIALGQAGHHVEVGSTLTSPLVWCRLGRLHLLHSPDFEIL
jgi:hypothetical protein